MRSVLLIPLILMSCSLIGGGRQDPVVSTRGSVCGDPWIKGEEIGEVESSVRGCGVAEAVQVQSIGGLSLSQRAIMECGTARTLRRWIDGSLKPAVGTTGGGVASLKVAAHYACRTRNSRKGARISEHGKGRAIDIASFRLNDGDEISVLNDWGEGKKGRILQRLHKSACGPFGTVLGPDSDRHHQDHFHLDTARHRNGSYCR